MKTSRNNAIPCIFLVLLLLSAIILPGCSGTGREAGNTQAAAPGDAAGPDGPTGGSDVSSSGSAGGEDSAADGGKSGDAPATAVQSPETQGPAEPQPGETPGTSGTNQPPVDAAESGSTDDGPSPVLSPDEEKIRSLTSPEAAARMGNGINLGNTMEAYGRKSLGLNAPVSSYETFWGQPVTTREIIHSMKAAGFDSLRIPVAWTNTMDFENGDYTIRKDYLKRVGEIIDYAIAEDMFVVVNDHWDGGWWGMFGSASRETRDKAMEMYISMWRQIADEFKDHSYRLIFESANEELGTRLNDKDIAKNSGTLSEGECYEMTNRINQVFVDTIRSTGGKNTDRFLLIAGFNTDIEKTCDNRFVMPKDTAKDKLLVSVHYYTPWEYCGTASLNKWGSKKDYDTQNGLLEKMTKFTKQGYGVVIGEYAVALNSDGSVKNNTVDFFNNFLNNCDLYGYVPMLWDCSSLFIRRNLGFKDEDVAKVFKERSLEARANMTEEGIAAAAKAGMEEAYAAAVSTSSPAFNEDGTPKAIAWIMFNSSDWGTTYSVGDVYNPDSITEGVVPTDVEITGEGTYTVSLDFTGTGAGYANSFAFTALGISNGESLFPDYVIIILDVQINGQSCKLKGKPYTTADDGICTRVNLYNEWVPKIPAGIRTADGSAVGASATPLDPGDYTQIKTISVTFRYVPRSSPHQ